MESYLKRKITEVNGTDGDAKIPKREECPHKERCYRKNPHHFKEFQHPFLISLLEMGDSVKIPDNMPQPKDVYLEQLDILRPIIEAAKKPINNIAKSQTEIKEESLDSNNMQPSTSKVSRKGKTTVFNPFSIVKTENSELVKNTVAGTMLHKLKVNDPYNLFFTTIPKSPETYKETNAVTFTDLLCPSLGTLKCSLQINFMIDIDWLLKQYKIRNLHTKPLTILYGDDWPDMVEFMDKFCPNVKYHFVKMKDPFGCHHSKVGIYVYEDNSLRIVVSTANLYYEDWNHYNQGLWISPVCPKLPEGSTVKDGESPTSFKQDLIKYLQSYNLAILKEWIEYVKNADFSNVKVALVYSTPGKHYPKSNGNHLHKVGDLLSQHCTLPVKTTPESEGPLSWGIMAQASSIGSMGKSPAEWFRGNLLRSLASHKQSPRPNNSQATISIIYPSVENVANGYFGLESGGCLPYSKATNEKQKWLQTYMHQWIADGRNRTRAMPHIKTYCRVSPDLCKLAFFLITSANLSKSAWGSNIQKDGGSYIRSYEMGVMFLPKFFGEEYFEISNSPNMKNKKVFPFIYDLPLTPFKKDDYPWCN
ncbi:probable tyrosyl-DNA phosphodiesterase [Sitophilus oryzae]|uniref:Probable tyrosyl-DNA phosphodiesterase n=1 Tax=Sitophilus oryzae TaxID=7048 RepID=A0A6J2YVL0_SITOR|nr:probable tyrosyl-DNA phosphodiesterase [Sitophilus oryzae]